MNLDADSERYPKAQGKPLVALIVFIVCVGYHLSYFNVGLNLSDEGVLLEGIRLHRSGTLDFEQFCHWTSLYGWFAALTRFSGAPILIIRLVWVVVRSATAVIAWQLGWRLGGPFAIVPLALTLLASGPWHKSFVPFLIMVAIWITDKAVQQAKTIEWIAAAGVIGLSLSIHIYTGALNCLAFLLSITISRLRARDSDYPLSRINLARRLALFAGCLLAFSAIFGSYLFTINWSDWIARHRQVVSSDYLGFNEAFSLLLSMNEGPLDWRSFLRSSYLDLPIGCVLATGLLLVGRRTKWSRESNLALVVTIFTAIHYAKVLARFDRPHLFQNAVPAYVLLSLILKVMVTNTLSNSKFSRLGWGVSCLAITAFAGTMAYEVATTSDYYTGGIGIIRTEREQKLQLPHAPIYLNRGDVLRFEAIVTNVTTLTDAGETMLCLPFIPMFYYLCQRPSPTVLPLFDRKEDFYSVTEESIIRALQVRRTRVALIQDLVTDAKEQNRFSRIAPVLHDYLATTYEPHAEWGDLKLAVIRTADEQVTE